MECGYCEKPFSSGGDCSNNQELIPRQLPCGHTLCTKCAAKTLCPIDHYKLHDDDEKSNEKDWKRGSKYPVHSILTKLIQLVDQQKRKKIEEKEMNDDVRQLTMQTCDLCDEDNSKPARYRCRVENLFLCVKHSKLHKSKIKTMNHSLVDVKEEAENLSLLSDKDKYCKKHKDDRDPSKYKLIRFFCSVCEKLVCRECYTEEHRGHRVSQIRDALRVEHTRQAELVVKARKDLREIEFALENLRQVERKLKGCIDSEKKKIDEKFDTLISVLDSREVDFEKIIAGKDTDKKMKTEDFHVLVHLSRSLERRKNIYPFLEVVLKYNEMLAEYQASSQLDSTLFYVTDPKILADVSEMGQILTDEIDPSLTKITGAGSQHVGMSHRGTFRVSTFNMEKRPCGMSPSILKVIFEGEMESDASVEIINQGLGEFVCKYRLYKPAMKEVTMKIYCKGVMVNDSHGKSWVVKVNNFFSGLHLAMFGQNGSGAGDLSSPWSICIKDGRIYVTEYSNNRVSVFETSGKFLFNFGSRGNDVGQLNTPEGICVDGEEIFIADYSNNRIAVFNLKGEPLRVWGSSGSGNGQFNNPIGVRVSKDEVYVVEHSGCRVQVFDRKGMFLRKWGTRGSGDGELNSPWDLFVNDLEVFVCEYGNHRITVFDKFGKCLRKFGSYGSGENQLNNPEGIWIDKSLVYIADYSNYRVAVFDTNGNWVRAFGSSGSGESNISGPIGIQVYEGILYVVEYNNHRIHAFE